MPTFESSGAQVYYEEHGEGFPVLLLAPGGMRSSIEFWERAPWHPVRELAAEFRMIALDQRNAGRSRAEIASGDGWHSYAADQVALLDHLRIERCHVIGGCIGGSFALRLIEAVPERIAAAVLQQPIGLSQNRDVFYALFDSWAAELEQQPGRRLDAAALAELREALYGGEFVFSVSRDFVRACATPLLVLLGNDVYHPSETSREIAALAPNAQLIERWKDAESVAEAVRRVRAFLREHAQMQAR